MGTEPSFAIACGEPAELLEAVEAAFDAVAELVQGAVVLPLGLPALRDGITASTPMLWMAAIVGRCRSSPFGLVMRTPFFFRDSKSVSQLLSTGFDFRAGQQIESGGRVLLDGAPLTRDPRSCGMPLRLHRRSREGINPVEMVNRPRSPIHQLLGPDP